STPVVPSTAGLGIDVPGTLDPLVGFSLDPRSLLRHLRGDGDVPVVTTRDDAVLATRVRAAAASLDQPLVQGSVDFTADGAVLHAGQPGRIVDQGGTSRLLADRWLTEDSLSVPFASTAPVTDPAALQRFYDDTAKPAAAGPLRVVVGARTVTVPVSRLAPALSVVVTAGEPALNVDGALLEKAVRDIDPGLAKKPVDARIVLRGSTPTVVPGVVGQRVDPVALAAAVTTAVGAPERTAKVAPAVVQPELSTAKAKALGVTEQVSTFTTKFPVNPPRTNNIRIAARTLNGILVRPGELFSLNDALGRRTPGKGYQQAPVIDGGRLTKDYGGGVSQVSTTLFNAVFFAGLDTVTHKPHSFYISRYPEGREATVSFPTVDQTFRNDSGHGILISTSVAERTITVSFYGTKVWDVEATKGPRTNVREPRTIQDASPGCVPQAASVGFDVSVSRIFRRGGATVRTERFSTRYIPEDHVICG
ncbi:MAG: VanW family protein, partial [Actinomycetota bacterium]